jgi:hypothetical protein
MTRGSIPSRKEMMKGFSPIEEERMSVTKITNCKAAVKMNCFQSAGETALTKIAY